VRGTLTSAVLAAGLLAAAPVSRDVRERAYRANNRGVALLEQFKYDEAAAAFRQALSLDPEPPVFRINLAIALLNVPDLPGAEREARASLAGNPDAPQVHYVLGLAARGQNRPDEAKAAFRKLLALDAQDVGANVNLGQILMQERSYPEAVAAFRAALAAQPHSATAAYNLGLALTRSGQAEQGQAMMERFRLLREGGTGTLIGQSYPEQGRYAEAIASTGAEADLVDDAVPAVRFVDATPEALRSAPSGKGRPTLLDLDGDADLDVYDVSAAGQRLYRNEGGRFMDVTRSLGLDPAAGGVGAVAGDLDNDGRPDLLVLRAGGVSLYRSSGSSLADATTTSGLASAGSALAAALADFDHDGDLDVLLAGTGTAARLLRNAGDASFKDVSASSFKERGASAGAILAAVPTDFDNGRDMDLLLVQEAGAPRLLRNLRDGTFRDVAGEVGLGRAARLRCVAAGDVNKDAFTDFFLGAEEQDRLALSDGRGRFSLAAVPWGSSGTTAAQFLDYDGDGLLDLLAFSAAGARLMRNLGSRWADLSAEALGEARRTGASAFAAGDLDGDGDTDLLLRTDAGVLRLWRNEGGSGKGAIRVRLAGVVSNRSGIGAKVEMRAGSLGQKLETHATTPAAAPADLVFGLGRREAPDAVRVIWPSGTVQTELDAKDPKPPRLFEITELDRKPSSCPYLYAWNGRSFAFVSDFMGGGEMGYSMAPGVWNRPDPLEYVRLTDDQLRPSNGRYQLRVTNELEEALFVDQLALLAVAHPEDIEVHPNEGMTDPPKPFRLYALTRARPPLSAVDDHGHDVLDRIARMDRLYPDDFRLERIRGYAAEHSLTLDLGATAERSVLLLTGWTDYAFSSDNVAASQAGLAMRPPSLEVQDASGRWVGAIEQVGIPVGRPQTVVADLSGVWRGSSRRVRIATNMRIYWDQVRVADVADVPLDPVTLHATAAQLRERGFSAEVSPDGRRPFGYDYQRVSRASPWKAFPGRYTREGDVRELLASTDDVFVVSRPGDEIALSFDARELPALRSGWKRTFLVLSDGFSKEMDINSATPDSLGPLPFHGMSGYPYAPPEAFPMSAERARLIERYNTRVVRTPLARLETALPGADGR
jgi:tetratricopeptide (TPR) repeat protein